MRHMDPTREPLEPDQPPNSIPRRPARGQGVSSIVVNMTPGPTLAEQTILLDPCLNGRHFPAHAYLTRGGTALVCRRCGTPL